MQKQDEDLDLEIGEAIEVVYDAVVDRSRFDELVSLALKVSGDEGNRAEFQSLRNALDTHVLTAEKLLANLPVEPIKTDNVPVVTVDAAGCVRAANGISKSLLGVAIGEKLTDTNATHNSKKTKSAKTGKLPSVLRLRRLDSGKSYILVAQAAGEPDQGLTYKGAETPWNEDASTAIRLIFGLTVSEAQIMGLLVSGYSPTEIAEYRVRSIDTVRQQIKTIYGKTGCKGLPELLQLAQAVLRSAKGSSASGTTGPVPARHGHRILEDGRRMDYSCQGADEGEREGQAIVFIHGCLCGNLFPDEASQYLRSRGVRLVAPARPAHGGSTNDETLLSDPSRYADDLIGLMDHLGINEAHLIGFDIGALYGLCVSSNLGKRLRSLTCVSAHPPIRGLRDIAAMPQQQRIFTILPRVSLPLLRLLAKTGDRKLKRDGPDAFRRTVFAGAEADLKACEDPDMLKLFWAGHHFHVEKGSDGFINDCRLAASHWISSFEPPEAGLSFVHGSENATIPIKRIEDFASTLNAELRVVQGAGHCLPFTHWRELFSSILD